MNKETTLTIPENYKIKIENCKKELSITPSTIEKLNTQGVKHLIHSTLLNPEELSNLYDIDIGVAKKIVKQARTILKIRTKPLTWTERSKLVESLLVILTGISEFDNTSLYKRLKLSFSYDFADEFGTGKSLLAHQIVVSEIKKLGCKVIYIGTENSYSPNILPRLVERFQKLIKIKLFNSIYHMLFKIIDELEAFVKTDLISHIIEQNVRVVVIDSTTELYRAQFAGHEKLAKRQQRFHYILDLLRRFQVEFKILVLMIDQVMDLPVGFIEIKKPVDDNVLAYTINYRFMIKRPGRGN